MLPRYHASASDRELFALRCLYCDKVISSPFLKIKTCFSVPSWLMLWKHWSVCVSVATLTRPMGWVWRRGYRFDRPITDAESVWGISHYVTMSRNCTLQLLKNLKVPSSWFHASRSTDRSTFPLSPHCLLVSQ